ncbi:MAG: hypothetical protein ACAH83_07345 [Alphaproteobacteria bacterium]
MSSSQIPPSKPVSVPSVQTQGQSISPAAPARLLIHDVPVRQAPPSLQNPPQPVHIEGRVISSNPQTQELRIATASGEVTVQSAVSLPPDTLVSVDIYMQKGVALATITLLRQQVQMSQDLEQMVQPQTGSPPPPLKPGDVVQAMYVPEPHDVAAPPRAPAAPPALPLEQVAEIINNFPTSSLSKLPVPLPEGAVQAATMPDVLATLKNLPAAQQAQVAAYLARPDVIEALKKILPPEIAKNLQLPEAAPPTTALPEEEPLDDNILQIVKVQTGARMTGTTSTVPAMPLEGPESASAPPPVLAVLKGLLPLIEALQPQESPLNMLVQQLMPARPAPGGLPLAELMPQSMYEVKVVSITPPGISAPPVKPGETQGIAESVSPRGFPVIRVDNDLFILKTLAPVPPRSIVTFQAQALTADQAIRSAVTTASTTGADWFHPLLSHDWPALQETLQAITTTAPTLMQNLRDTLPQATPRLVPTALFFLAALRAGDVQSWLGEPVVQALRQSGRLNLIDRLTGDFSKIAATAKETVAGDWRAMSMPMLHDDQISQIQFFVRRQHDDEDQKKDEGGSKPVTRFILNLRLSRMGDMQLDGLLRQKKFDLILRSAEQLPFSMRQDLMQAFARGLAQADMAGGVSFQAKAQSWVSIGVPNQGTVA